jgi:hypothetical protein
MMPTHAAAAAAERAIGNNVESRRQPITNVLMADSPF